MASASVAVFVRVRPLIEPEAPDVVKGLTLSSSEAEQVHVVALEDKNTTIGGFAGVLGQEAANVEVFDRCFSDEVQTVLRGGTASLFCYGYTGSGKTHTVFGVEQDRGVCHRAAESLLEQVAS